MNSILQIKIDLKLSFFYSSQNFLRNYSGHFLTLLFVYFKLSLLNPTDDYFYGWNLTSLYFKNLIHLFFNAFITSLFMNIIYEQRLKI